MSTENVRPCFAMLKDVGPIRDRHLLNDCQEIDSSLYLSSYFHVHNVQKRLSESIPHIATTTQGPSIEVWNPYKDRSKSGTDFVFSLHCSFWPDVASACQQRSPRFQWPSQCDVKTIVNFGFHLVPIGHPKSNTNMMEWRISFSVAERTFVWYFNHIQMQCYAVINSEGVHQFVLLPFMSCVMLVFQQNVPVVERLKSSLKKFYGRYGDLIKHYEVSLSQMLHDILGHDHIQ